MKFLYIIVALSLLAMMIPAMTVSVSAADLSTLSMNLVDGSSRIPDGSLDEFNTIRGFNVLGSTVEITSSQPVLYWNIGGTTVVPGYSEAHWVPNVDPGTATTVQVQGQFGEASIYAHYAGPDNDTDHVNKKWGPIARTRFNNADQTTTIIWNEAEKAWYATGTITDNVVGTFLENGGYTEHPAQGAILNWYLVDGKADLTSVSAAGAAATLKTAAAALADAKYTEFVTPPTFDPYDTTTWDGVTKRTISGVDGSSTVNIAAWFMEKVTVVVIPEYPNDPNRTVTPEIAFYSFNNNQIDIVPQVRWAGEKIVLEAVFGEGVSGDVNFYLQNQSVGTLEGIDDDSEGSTVWTETNDNGTATVILTSDVAGQADVTAALYPHGPDAGQTNQYRFRVYFLNFYSLTLGDVYGKRDHHNAGRWVPENPYNTNFPDNATDEGDYAINVSQDALERAQVKGWFMPSTKLSLRPVINVDLNGDGSTLEDADMNDVLAPAGHYVLPDDWQYLMTSQTFKKYWDIMDDPSDSIAALEGGIAAVSGALGPYKTADGTGATVTDAEVIGPFAPGIETMTPNGWMTTGAPTLDPLRDYYTIVPNGNVDAWDAPMPPAKITFTIVPSEIPNTAAGFFKEALKTDIYYETVSVGGVDTIAFTSPFYAILVPAHESIPPFNKDNGGHYDWNSFDLAIGPYTFWEDLSPSGTKPTIMEVYSDNHGEAMVWLNGDANLDLSSWVDDGGIDVAPGAQVATTHILAEATYPYAIVDKSIYSLEIEKAFTWGGMILGMENNFPYAKTKQVDPAWYRMVLATGAFNWDEIEGLPGHEKGFGEKRMVWVWVTDRDGKQASTIGTPITWIIRSGNGATIYQGSTNGNGVSAFNSTMEGINVENGFLMGTKRLPNPMNTESYHNDSWTIGYAKTVAPTGTMVDLFTKFYGTQVNLSTNEPLVASDFSVAAIEVDASMTATSVEVKAIISLPGLSDVSRVANLDWTTAEDLDDPIQFGDANGDGEVNMADVVTVERMILQLEPRVTDANAYWNCNSNGAMIIDMADVIRIEKIILTGN